jgi:hypothetical protein
VTSINGPTVASVLDFGIGGGTKSVGAIGGTGKSTSGAATPFWDWIDDGAWVFSY